VLPFDKSFQPNVYGGSIFHIVDRHQRAADGNRAVPLKHVHEQIKLAAFRHSYSSTV
jgi:hypothetical protein